VLAHLDRRDGKRDTTPFVHLGDGFLAVFVSTRRALACAIGIQRALDSFNLSRVGMPLRVRIGLRARTVAVAMVAPLSPRSRR